MPSRVLTFVQMAGSLVLAAGVPRALDEDDWVLVVAGFVLMRAALTAQWLRAARNESGPARTTTRRYAAGLVACQVGWLGMLVLPDTARPWWFLTSGAAVTVPVAVFLIAVWLLHNGHPRLSGRVRPVLPAAALLVLCCTAAGAWAVPVVGLVMVAAVTGSFLAAHRSRRGVA